MAQNCMSKGAAWRKWIDVAFHFKHCGSHSLVHKTLIIK